MLHYLSSGFSCIGELASYSPLDNPCRLHSLLTQIAIVANMYMCTAYYSGCKGSSEWVRYHAVWVPKYTFIVPMYTEQCCIQWIYMYAHVTNVDMTKHIFCMDNQLADS